MAEMTGPAYAFTLTVRSWPSTSQAWQKLRRVWLKRVERAVPGVVWHWVMETQLRGAPHLHGALVLPVGAAPLSAVQQARLIQDWVQVAADFGPGARRQKIEAITSADGWSRYVAKHSARSAGHAQRREIPPGWETTGRLWGHSQRWVIRGQAYRLNPRAVVEVRRLIASWRRSDASTRLRLATELPAETVEQIKIRDSRLAAARRAVSSSRTMLRGRAGVAAVRGLREWVPEDVQLQMFAWVASIEEVGAGGELIYPAKILTEENYDRRRAVWIHQRGLVERARRRLDSLDALGLPTVNARVELAELERVIADGEAALTDHRAGFMPAV